MKFKEQKNSIKISNTVSERLISILLGSTPPILILLIVLYFDRTPRLETFIELVIPLLWILLYFSGEREIERLHHGYRLKEFMYSKNHSRNITLFTEDKPEIWYHRTGGTLDRYHPWIVKTNAIGGRPVAYSLATPMAEATKLLTTYPFYKDEEIADLAKLLGLKPIHKENMRAELHGLEKE